MTAADRWFATGALASVLAVAAALASQHVWGMQPCAWCVLQRLIYLAIAAACVVGLVWRRATGRVVAGAIALALALSGIAAAAWQHFAAAHSASCAMTFADRVVSGWLGLDRLAPEVFEARASCADAAVDLAGVPYALWSLALFALLAGLMIAALRPGRRGVGAARRYG